MTNIYPDGDATFEDLAAEAAQYNWPEYKTPAKDRYEAALASGDIAAMRKVVIWTRQMAASEQRENVRAARVRATREYLRDRAL